MLKRLVATLLLLATFTCVGAWTWRPRSLEARQQRIGHLWVTDDIYQGPTFFDEWDFFSYNDPTNGRVEYVTREDAFGSGLTYVQKDGIAVMKGDNSTWLEYNGKRKSVRISSKKKYTGGLFILDTNRAPWGCAVWPAWWTVGDNWPNNGEIDIIEGVHDNTHNQVAWHTAPGCLLTNTKNFTGTIVHTTCDASINSNSGCGVADWSRVSYGPEFEALGGGLYAMLWDETGIAVWYFYRNAIPTDLLELRPDPTSWSLPSAYLSPIACNISQYFKEHVITFDITFCGDWAGNSYATSGCPGTCGERIMDPKNFDNATWSINSLRVYRKQVVFGASDATALRGYSPVLLVAVSLCIILLTRI